VTQYITLHKKMIGKLSAAMEECAN